MKKIITSFKIMFALVGILVANMNANAQCQGFFTYIDNGNGVYTFLNNSFTNDSSWISNTTWTVNNNSVGTGDVLTFTFQQGTYNVCVNTFYYDPNDSLQYCSADYCYNLVVGGGGGSTLTCNAGIGWNAGANGTYYFNSTSTSSASNVNTNVVWTLNGNTLGYNNNLTHTFTQNGTYTICLDYYAFDAIDSTMYCSDTECLTVTVTGLGGSTNNCLASFVLYEDSISPGVFFGYNNSLPSNPNNTMSYTWDFGDGSSSNLQYPLHNYSQMGSYTICLTINEIDSNNTIVCTSSMCDSTSTYFKTAGQISSLQIMESVTAGVKTNNLSKTKTTVYPVPFTNELTFENANTRISEVVLVNILGETVASVSNVAANSIVVNTESLSNGYYVAKVKDVNGNVTSQKVVK